MNWFRWLAALAFVLASVEAAGLKLFTPWEVLLCIGLALLALSPLDLNRTSR